MSALARHSLALLCCAALALLGGCAGLGGAFEREPQRAEPAAGRPSVDADAARANLLALAELHADTPAGQAERVQKARALAETAPTTPNRLRYALMLALPGHGAADAVAARRQLSDLLARPELLLPSERALATVLLAEVDERQVLAAQTRQSQQDGTSRDKDRITATQKRLQTEQEENTRLRRALEDAQKKLDAVTQVEQSITGRGNPPKH
jgi:hypothetical protein